jgi:hypothetical protein
MCEFRKLILESAGYVAQCPYCRSVEIAFGTSVVNIGLYDWTRFGHYISSVRRNGQASDNPNLKQVMLHLGGGGPLQMFLTIVELQELCDLIDRADSEMRARNLLEQFKG